MLVSAFVSGALISGIPALATQDAAVPQKAASDLSAREVFYQVEASASSPKPQKATHAQHRPSSNSTASTHSNTAAPPSSIASNENGSGDELSDAGAQPRLQQASLTNKEYPPLGLRYSVYQLVDGQKQPVSADAVFHSNDHIQFVVEVNTPAYLYVVSRGASGRWTTLFPHGDAPPSASLVQPHHPWVFPPNEMVTFTEPAGKEELFMFLSRQPVASAEDLMLQLSGAKSSTPTAQPKLPVAPQSNAIEAFNRMDDSQFQALETAYSRDLIVEKVNSTGAGPSTPPAPETPGVAAPATPDAPPANDNSVYVVNPSGRADSHVVATVVFHHE